MCPKLGEFVANLMEWKGSRVAQDQVWAKPPLSSALVFHRDSPYFDFVPADGLTVKEEPIDCNDCGICDTCNTIHGIVMSIDFE